MEIEEQETEKKTTANLTKKLSIIPKKILLSHFLENVKQWIKQAKPKKVPEKSLE